MTTKNCTKEPLKSTIHFRNSSKEFSKQLKLIERASHASSTAFSVLPMLSLPLDVNYCQSHENTCDQSLSGQFVLRFQRVRFFCNLRVRVSLELEHNASIGTLFKMQTHFVSKFLLIPHNLHEI